MSSKDRNIEEKKMENYIFSIIDLISYCNHGDKNV